MLMAAIVATLASVSASQDETPATIAYRAAKALLQEEGLDAYLEVRPSLATAEMGQPRRIYLDLLAVPVNQTENELRLELIQSWLEGYDEADSWRARLAIEGADSARVIRNWALTWSLLDQAELDLGAPSEDPSLNEMHSRAWLHDVRGVMAREMGLFDIAAAELAKQQSWADRSNDLSLRVNALFNAITLSANKNDAAEVRATLKQTPADLLEGLVPDNKQRLDFIVALCFMEEARLQGGSYREAESLLRNVAQAPGASNYRKGRAILLLAHLHLLDNKPASAKEQLRSFEEIDGSSMPGGPQLELGLHHATIVGWLATEEPSPEGDRLALQEVERGLNQLLETWDTAPVQPAGFGYRSYYDSKLLVDAALQLRARRDERDVGSTDSLALILKVQSLGSLARSMGLPAPSIAEVERALLTEDNGLLILVPGYLHSWAFAWDRAGVIAQKIAPEYRLEDLAEDLQLAILDSVASNMDESDDVARASRALERALLPDEIRDRISTWRDLTVVGSESLGWLPLEVLRGSSGERFGTSHGLSYLPSLPIGVHLARPGPPQSEDMPAMLFAAGTGASESALDQWMAEDLGPYEAQLLSAVDPYDRSAITLLGSELTGSNLKSALPQARIAHVVTHGIYDPQRIRPAGLLLAPDDNGDGELWTADVDGWKWPELVLLSSCGVHRGPLRRGDDGRALLAGSLFAGGARAVMLPYVDLELNGHLSLAHDIHKHLIKGKSPQEALRLARREAGPGLSKHLFHLAGFGAVPVVSPTANVGTGGHLYWLWGGFLIIGISLMWLGIRRLRSAGATI